MMKFLGVFILIIAVGLLTYFSNTKNIKKNEAQVKVKQELNKAINLRKNKRENSQVFKLLKENKIKELITYIDKTEPKKQLSVFKDLLVSRVSMPKLSEGNKHELLTYLAQKHKNENKKVNIYKYRIYPHLLKNNNNEKSGKIISDLFTNTEVGIEEKSLMFFEMKNWAKIPQSAMKFIKNNIFAKEERNVFVALTHYSSLNDREQYTTIYNMIKGKIEDFKEEEKIIIYSSLLSKAKMLNLEKTFFDKIMTTDGHKWDPLKLDFIKKFSLQKEYLQKLRSIASGTNNHWVKERAKTIMETAK